MQSMELKMLIEELYDFYKSWSVMSRKLELSPTTYLGWKRRGYIPWQTQLVIEKKTHGKFKAKLDHGKSLSELK